jgi:hypothetical protein
MRTVRCDPPFQIFFRRLMLRVESRPRRAAISLPLSRRSASSRSHLMIATMRAVWRNLRPTVRQSNIRGTGCLGTVSAQTGPRHALMAWRPQLVRGVIPVFLYLRRFSAYLVHQVGGLSNKVDDVGIADGTAGHLFHDPRDVEHGVDDLGGESG